MATNIEAFNRILSRAAKKVPEEMLVPFQQQVCFQVLDGVIFKTRVRTGRARGGWQVGIDQIPTGPGRKSKSGAGTKSRGRAKIAKLNAYQVCYIVNNVEYITYLEEGTDKRPGDHMLALTLLEVSFQFISTLQSP